MFGKKTILAVVVLLLAYAYNAYKNSNRERTPVLETKLGQIQGIVSESRLGRKYFEFLGVPYAQPPVGELRFEPPRQVSKWNEVKDASKFGAECAQLQLLMGKFSGAEDCLYLNIFVPQERTKLLPVMVWLHGGAFVTGSSNGYRPSYFMDEDVVLVTINYRLAALGFLNTGDDVVRGNMGLKDQNMALKWVEQNIKSFGGDPSKVTLFGESAGSASASLHVLSPMSKGLFSKAILQSGTGTGNWVVFNEPAKQAKRFASKFGCPTDNSQDMVKCLKKIEVTEFVNMHKEMTLPLREQITIFTPTIEAVKDENAFLTQKPMDILKSGKFNAVPVIAGVNSDEGLLTSALIASNQTKLDQANNDFYFWAARILNYPEENKLVSDKIRKFYFGERENIGAEELIQNYTNIFSDRQFFVPLNHFVKGYSKNVPIYLYYFTYEGDFSFGRLLVSTQKPYLPVIANVIIDITVRWVKENVFGMKLDHPGVCHADELPFFYDWQLSPTIKPSSRQYSMSKDLVSLWVSFASNDKPLKFRNQEWTKVKPTDAVYKYLQVDTVPTIINEPFADRVKFWDTLNV